MTRISSFFAYLVLGAAIAGPPAAAPARADMWRPIALSDSLGPQIDANERAAYHLLPGVTGFVSARFSVNEHSTYRVVYTYEDSQGSHESTVPMTSDAWELTKLHAGIVERSRALAAAPDTGGAPEWQYRLALRYAAEARYEVARPLLMDIGVEHAQSPTAPEADSTLAIVNRLAGGPPGIYLPGELYDRSGRDEIMIFAGYYGLWAGIAVPVWANSDSPQAFAAGLLIGGPGALLLANALTKSHGITEGSATIISLGGNLGTWQGLGWAGLGNGDGNEVVGIGLVSGLAGIATGVAMTHVVHFTEGHAAVTNSGLLWGAWFGFLFADLAGVENEGLLRASLIGSDALVLGAGVAARNVRMSKERMRVITLMGVVGTAFGFGVDLLFQIDSEAALAVAGVGSIAGLVVGANSTTGYDQGKVLSSGEALPTRDGLSLAPRFSLSREGGRGGTVRPMVGVRVVF